MTSGPELVMGRLLDDLEHHGERPALVLPDETISYRRLARDSNRLANGLLRLGLAPGSRVAWLLPNGGPIVCCYLACAKSGIVGVPLSTRLTSDELVHQLQDSGAGAILYASAWADSIAEISDRVPGVEFFLTEDDYVRLLRDGAETGPPGELAPEDPFCVMYTGGTTGASKAAVQTQAAWAACVLSTIEEMKLVADDRHAVVLPMTHAAWFTVAAHLCVGAVTHVPPSWDPQRYVELVARERLSTLHMIPTMLGDVLGVRGVRDADFGSVRLLSLAGSAIPIELYRRGREVFGDVIGNIYGLTEAAGPVTFLFPPEMSEDTVRSGGHPGRYVEVTILDAEPSAEGDVGEVALRGPLVTPGYLNRPEENAEAFRDGWFCTGDIGFFDACGNLYIHGRKKDMIKTGGLNVYPKEIEDVLYTHPGVAEAAVIAVPDPRWMEAVTAVVALKPRAAPSSQELIAHCRARLAGYKVPKAVHLVDALPRTSFGKFDKRTLQARYEQHRV